MFVRGTFLVSSVAILSFTGCNVVSRIPGLNSGDVGAGVDNPPETCVEPGTSTEAVLTYDGEIKSIFEKNCTYCHQIGGDAFPLDTYELVEQFAVDSLGAIKRKSMPSDHALSSADYDKLVTWLSTPGLPRSAPPPLAVCPTPQPTPTPEPNDHCSEGHMNGCAVEQELPRVDLTVSFPVHTIQPDDLGDDNYTVSASISTGTPKPDPNKTYYIVGSEVEARDTKGKPHPALHHLLVLNGDALSGSGLRNLFKGGLNGFIYKMLNLWGAKVPGNDMSEMPTGYGMIFPGTSNLMLNVHCNTKMAPKDADKDIYITVKFMLEEKVNHLFYSPLVVNPEWLKGNMPIPANTANISHSYDYDPFEWTATKKTSLELFDFGYHMHALGVGGSYHFISTTGVATLFHQIMDFNYANQRQYPAIPAKRLKKGEKLRLTCFWDNSEAHQQYVDGVQLTSKDVNWGESSFDEMCMSATGFGEVD